MFSHPFVSNSLWKINSYVEDFTKTLLKEFIEIRERLNCLALCLIISAVYHSYYIFWYSAMKILACYSREYKNVPDFQSAILKLKFFAVLEYPDTGEASKSSMENPKLEKIASNGKLILTVFFYHC